MPLERRLSTAVAALTSLGTVMFALAQTDLRLGVVGVAAAASSVYFTDRKRWLVLNTLGANLAGAAAMAVTFWDWQRMERDLLFIALANLLVYLQSVLHFRRKAPRVYWMLILLSFLQVAVAAVLNSSVSFGCLLIVYVFLGLRALGLLSIHRECAELWPDLAGVAREVSGRPSLAEVLLTPLHRLLWRLLTARRRRPAPAARSDQPKSRWALAGQVAAFECRRARGRAGEDFARGLWPLVVSTGALTLIVTPLLFAILPRPGQANSEGWGGAPRGGPTLMGFSEDISLRDVTRIQDNPEEVLRVSFNRYDQGRAGATYELRDEPWLNGVVLGQYAWGMWTRERYAGFWTIALSDVPPQPQNDVVLQEITLEPLRNSAALFRVDPPYALPGQSGSDIRADPSTGQLFRPDAWLRKAFTYQLLTDGFQDGRQLPFRLERRRYNARGAAAAGTSLRDQRFQLLSPFAAPVLPHHNVNEAQRLALSGLKSQADAIVAQKRVDPLRNPRAAAQALEEYLRESGLFSYTLERLPKDPSIPDPIEDFVVRGRVGQCEYFASALTLMLRSQGIPARVVVGYKGGEWNAVGGYYVVRQSNAHAWVEAWILEEDRPLGWLRLDPTPSGQMADTASLPGLWQVANYLEYLWLRYVLGMNAQLQRDALLDPAAALFDKTIWQGWFAHLRKWFANEDWSADRWLSWRAGVAAVAVQVGLVLVILLVRRLRRRRLSRGAGSKSTRQSAARVEFYQRLETLLQRLGLRRSVGQTPLEFALAAAHQLASQSTTTSVSSVPPRVTEAYYRLRYGGETLDETKTAEIENALAGLEAATPRSA